MKVPSNVEFARDIQYANPDNVPLRLNLARPKVADDRLPAVVCFHGGGFRQGTRDIYDGLCLELATRGYVALTIQYRLSPQSLFPAAVQDCKSAIRWLRAHAAEYRVDPDRIAVWGGSAGGNLVLMMVATAGVPEFERGDNLGQSSAVACGVSFCGASDFTRSYGRSLGAASSLPNYFGGDLSRKRKEHIHGSPLYWITPQAAPTICIHGTEDPNVACEQSVWMVERLLKAGVKAELFSVQGAGHGFRGADRVRADAAGFSFLDRQLKNKQ
ncbi:MAG: alpha/beta hydrolase [Bryobacterales bacterium]|nr:alpha/beta hydrolase [Bryobacterales bacterium]